MSKWSVVCEPVGENPGVVTAAMRRVTGSDSKPENIGGMIIFVTNGSTKSEVSRVAYVRRDTVCKNPKNSFEKQLDIEIGKAQKSVATLNDLMAGAGSMQ